MNPALRTSLRRLAAVLGVICVAALAACGPPTPSIATGGVPERGVTAIKDHGCGGCHTIPGVRDANGTVGPPLDKFSKRMYIAGHTTNTPEHLVKWLRDPPSVEPGTAMPIVGLDDQQAKDVAAYLYTLK